MALTASLALHLACVLMALATEALIGAAAAGTDRAMRRRRAAAVRSSTRRCSTGARTATSGSQQAIVSAADARRRRSELSALRPGFNGARHPPGLAAVVARATRHSSHRSHAARRRHRFPRSPRSPRRQRPPDLAPDTLRSDARPPARHARARMVLPLRSLTRALRVAYFGNRIAAFFDITRGALPAVRPIVRTWHHVAGLIASSGELSADGRYQGIGPRVRLVGMKVLDASGAGRTSDVIRAVELTHPSAAGARRSDHQFVARSSHLRIRGARPAGARRRNGCARRHRRCRRRRQLRVEAPDDEVGFGGITSPATHLRLSLSEPSRPST